MGQLPSTTLHCHVTKVMQGPLIHVILKTSFLFNYMEYLEIPLNTCCKAESLKIILKLSENSCKYFGFFSNLTAFMLQMSCMPVTSISSKLRVILLQTRMLYRGEEGEILGLFLTKLNCID